MRPETHISPKGGRSSSVRTDTTLGASPIARIDATIAIYMMIHMVLLPDRTHAL